MGYCNGSLDNHFHHGSDHTHCYFECWLDVRTDSCSRDGTSRTTTNHNKDQDVIKMRALSNDDSTYKFLLSASQDAPIQATDFQGKLESNSTRMVGYFGCSVGKQPLQCYMVTNTRGFSFIPQWKLVKVSLSVVHSADPNWLNGTN